MKMDISIYPNVPYYWPKVKGYTLNAAGGGAKIRMEANDVEMMSRMRDAAHLRRVEDVSGASGEQNERKRSATAG